MTVKLKICFICSEYPPASNGGIGNYVKTLAENLVTQGHKVRVIGLYKNYHSIENIRGVEVYRIKKTSLSYLWVFNALQIRRVISGWIARKEIDIVEDNDWDLYSSFFYFVRVPVVLRLHNGFLARIKNKGELPLVKRWMTKRAIRKAKGIVGVSRFVVNEFKRVFPDVTETEVIYNGVSVAEEIPDFSQRVSCQAMFAGTLIEEKGIIQLVKAWKLVLDEFPSARLIVFGKDRSNSNGNSMVDLLKGILGDDQSAVEFRGHVTNEELDRALRLSTVFIAPSYFEAFSLAPLEAMAQACPTIFTTLTSGPEAIHDEIDGLLVNPDRIEEIAESVKRIFRSGDLARYLGEAGYERVKDVFNIEHVAGLNLDYYQVIMSRK